MIKRIETDLLEIGYRDYGNANDIPVILLHGFPYDINAFNETSEILSKNGCRVLTPFLRGFGETKFKSELTMRSGQQAALAHDIIDFMNALHIDKAIIGGYDWGGRASCIVSALWSERILGLVSVGGYTIQNIEASKEPSFPNFEQLYWYQYYFHSERGRKGLEKYRKELCKILWSDWSPNWKFDNNTYEVTAQSFENSDFVDVVIHSYRHRYALVGGDKRYDETEKRLADLPAIRVPTIVLDPGSDGVVPLIGNEDDSEYFIGKYKRKILQGIGHNLPQEAAADFAEAILELKN
ncbi:MAG: alpha/beta hydrolase [Chitinophagaceae bacterium]